MRHGNVRLLGDGTCEDVLEGKLDVACIKG